LKQLALNIVTPEREVISEAVDEVELPSWEGSMGVLPDHAPLLAQLQVGQVSYRVGDQRHYLAVTGGFAEVLGDAVSVLARSCERAEEIDLDRAKQAESRALEQLKSEMGSDTFDQAEVKLKRAIARINTHGRRQV
jgi:F-type H+-transporting ATPase subunit epsilon